MCIIKTIASDASATKTYRQLRTSEVVPRFQRHCMAVPSFEVAYLTLVTLRSHKSPFAEIKRDVALCCELFGPSYFVYQEAFSIANIHLEPGGNMMDRYTDTRH